MNDKRKKELAEQLTAATAWVLLALVAMPLLALAFRVAVWILGV